MTDGLEEEDVLEEDVPGVVEVVNAAAAREARMADQLRQLVERRPELARRPYVRAKVEGRQPDFAHQLQPKETEGGAND